MEDYYEANPGEKGGRVLKEVQYYYETSRSRSDLNEIEFSSDSMGSSETGSQTDDLVFKQIQLGSQLKAQDRVKADNKIEKIAVAVDLPGHPGEHLFTEYDPEELERERKDEFRSALKICEFLEMHKSKEKDQKLRKSDRDGYGRHRRLLGGLENQNNRNGLERPGDGERNDFESDFEQEGDDLSKILTSTYQRMNHFIETEEPSSKDLHGNRPPTGGRDRHIFVQDQKRDQKNRPRYLGGEKGKQGRQFGYEPGKEPLVSDFEAQLNFEQPQQHFQEEPSQFEPKKRRYQAGRQPDQGYSRYGNNTGHDGREQGVDGNRRTGFFNNLKIKRVQEMPPHLAIGNRNQQYFRFDEPQRKMGEEGAKIDRESRKNIFSLPNSYQQHKPPKLDLPNERAQQDRRKVNRGLYGLPPGPRIERRGQAIDMGGPYPSLSPLPQPSNSRQRGDLIYSETALIVEENTNFFKNKENDGQKSSDETRYGNKSYSHWLALPLWHSKDENITKFSQDTYNLLNKNFPDLIPFIKFKDPKRFGVKILGLNLSTSKGKPGDEIDEQKMDKLVKILKQCQPILAKLTHPTPLGLLFQKFETKSNSNPNPKTKRNKPKKAKKKAKGKKAANFNLKRLSKLNNAPKKMKAMKKGGLGMLLLGGGAGREQVKKNVEKKKKKGKKKQKKGKRGSGVLGAPEQIADLVSRRDQLQDPQEGFAQAMKQASKQSSSVFSLRPKYDKNFERLLSFVNILIHKLKKAKLISKKSLLTQFEAIRMATAASNRRGSSRAQLLYFPKNCFSLDFLSLKKSNLTPAEFKIFKESLLPQILKECSAQMKNLGFVELDRLDLVYSRAFDKDGFPFSVVKLWINQKEQHKQHQKYGVKNGGKSEVERCKERLLKQYQGYY